MQSKTSYFNYTIYRTALRRYWVLWVLYAGALLLMLPVPMMNAMHDPYRYGAGQWFSASVIWMSTQMRGLPIFSFVAAAVVAAVLFNYLYTPRQMGLMNSLPVRREAMYFSTLWAGLNGMMIGNLLVTLACWGIEVINGQVCLPVLGYMLLILTITTLLFFGFAVVCCMLTGNILAGPAVYVIFNFTAVGVVILVNYLLDSLVYGLESSVESVSIATWLSPVVNLTSDMGVGYKTLEDAAGNITECTYFLGGGVMLAIYAAVGLVFIALGLWLYRNRRMETAGDLISWPKLIPVFRVLACLAGALCLSCLMSQLLSDMRCFGLTKLVQLFVFMVLGGFIGWFLAQMLVEKTIHVFRRGWKGLGVMCLMFLLFLSCAEFDWTGYEKRVPDGDDVASVNVNATGGYVDFALTDSEDVQQVLQLHQRLIDHKGSVEDALRNKTANQQVQLTYTLKNGNVMSRSYYMDNSRENYPDKDSDLRALQAVINLPNAIRQRCIVPNLDQATMSSADINYYNAETGEYDYARNLSLEEYEDLYVNCVVPDVEDGTLGQMDLVEDAAYAASKYACELTFWLDVPEPGSGSTNALGNRSVDIYVTTTATRTVQWLQNHGYELITMQEYARTLGSEITDTGWQDNTAPATASTHALG